MELCNINLIYLLINTWTTPILYGKNNKNSRINKYSFCLDNEDIKTVTTKIQYRKPMIIYSEKVKYYDQTIH
jgi:hypothetical protein